MNSLLHLLNVTAFCILEQLFLNSDYVFPLGSRFWSAYSEIGLGRSPTEAAGNFISIEIA